MSVAPLRKPARLLGPLDDGRRMALADFAEASGAQGYLYELERGIIAVVAVPDIPHSRTVRFIRKALEAYSDAHAGAINHVAGDLSSVMRMPEIETERHPDITVYLTTPPFDGAEAWDEWTPDIVIEVVSRTSRKRDYEVKPNDYLRAGVKAYWIIDPLDFSATELARRGDTWRTRKLTRRGVIRPAMLPGFELRLSDVFAVLK